MELHTVTCCPLGVSSRRGCTFHRRDRNLFLPTTSIVGDESIRYFDIKIMISPSDEHGARFYDAYFNKRLASFVRDKKPQDSVGKILVTIMSYDRILTTDNQNPIIFDKIYLGNKRSSTAYLYILSFSKGEEFAFDLIDDNDERKSYSLRYSSVTLSIEVVDWSEEDLRYKPQHEFWWTRFSQRGVKAARSAVRRFFPPLTH